MSAANPSGGEGPAEALLLRTFLSVAVPAEVRERILEAREGLRRANARVSWVAPVNLHLSLAFLGNVSRADVDMLAVALDEALADAAPFPFEVRGFGAFGGRSPRVLWAAAFAANDALGRLHALTVNALRAARLPFDAKPFRPHITIGRVRSPVGAEALVKLMTPFADTSFGSAVCTHVDVMRSELRPDGPRYSILHAAQLNAPRPTPSPEQTGP